MTERTHCKHGHELTPDNTMTRMAHGRPFIACRTCKRRATSEYNSRHRAGNRTERRARWLVFDQVRGGKIQRGPCAECGAKYALAHHPNGYDEEHIFDIVWLCPTHHASAHKAMTGVGSMTDSPRRALVTESDIAEALSAVDDGAGTTLSPTMVRTYARDLIRHFEHAGLTAEGWGVEREALREAARDAQNLIALTVTNVHGDRARPHWCRRNDGGHDATCSGMLHTQDALRAALEVADIARAALASQADDPSGADTLDVEP